MSEPIEHATFVIERELPASPRHAFRFWSEAPLKARWTSCHPDWRVLDDRFDFRVGGGEDKRWRTPNGTEQTMHAHYLDIVEGQRILYAYEMGFGGVRLSASLVTIVFAAGGRGTRVTYTEQVAILTGGAGARGQRLAGTEEGLDRLVAIAAAESATAPDGRVLS